MKLYTIIICSECKIQHDGADLRDTCPCNDAPLELRGVIEDDVIKTAIEELMEMMIHEKIDQRPKPTDEEIVNYDIGKRAVLQMLKDKLELE